MIVLVPACSVVVNTTCVRSERGVACSNGYLNWLLSKCGLHSVGRITSNGCVPNGVNASVGNGVVQASAIGSGIKVVGFKNSVVLVEIFEGDIDITSIAAKVAAVSVAIHKLLLCEGKELT